MIRFPFLPNAKCGRSPWGFLLLLSLLPLAAAVDTPSAGYAQANNGTILRVSGIAGAFVTTATEHTAAVSSGFSEQLGFVKLASSVRVVNAAGELLGESDAPAGPALFGFSFHGDSGVAYYPSNQSLAVFAAGQWTPAPFPLMATVLAVRMKDVTHVSALIFRDQLSLVTFRISDAAIEDETIIGPGSAPALLPDTGGVLFRRDDALFFHDPDGNDRALPLPSPASLQQMGVGWVQVQPESGSNLALRLNPEIHVYEIPEVSQ